MKKELLIRVMVPERQPDGQIGYRVEERQIRLPLRRRDRRELLERLNRDDG